MQVLSAAAQARLHAYLTRATFGLAGEQKQAVWDELEEHVLTRADHLCAFGTPYPQALSQALAELGPPQSVSAGMIKVYLMPKVMILTALAAVGIGGVVWAQSVQNISHLDGPLFIHTQDELCSSSQNHCQRSLFGQLSTSNKISSILKSRPAIDKKAALELLKAAGLQGEVEAQYIDGEKMEQALVISDNKGSNIYFIYDYFVTDGVTYYNMASILKAVAKQNPDIMISHSPELSLELGDQKIALEVSDNEMLSLFSWLSLDMLPSILSKHASYNSNLVVENREKDSVFSKQVYKIGKDIQKGELVMLIVYGEAGYYLDIAVANGHGEVEFEKNSSLERFVVSPSEISSTSQNLGNALLLRMTNTPLNDLASGIVQPLP